MSEPTVAIAAGGTGGHVYPGVVVAEALRQRGCRVIWLGTRRGLEWKVVPAAGLEAEWLEIQGVRGKSWATWLSAPWRLLWAVWSAIKVLRRRRPDVVLGMGGYVAGPAGIAARLTGVPLVVHEQNARAGMTNRVLARIANRVLTGFEGARGLDGTHVGNPIRSSIGALPPPAQRLAGRGAPLRLLVLGGSQGALTLNRAVPAALRAWPEDLPRPLVRHQSGEQTLDGARQAYREAGFEAEVVPFIDDMAAAYEWADLVIGRGGALTVSELAAAGVASVLVPLPWAVDDHQTANAEILGRVGAAQVLLQAAVENDELARLLPSLLSDRDRLLAMAEAARSVAVVDATERVVGVCMEVCR